MEQIFYGLVKSDKSARLKQAITTRIAQQATTEHPPETVLAMLRSAVSFIVDGETDEAPALSSQVFTEWAKHHHLVACAYFSAVFVDDLLARQRLRPLGVVWVTSHVLDLARKNALPSYASLCRVVGSRGSCFVRNNPDFSSVESFCSMLLEHKDAMPRDTKPRAEFASVILRVVKDFNVPDDHKSRQRYLIGVPGTIGTLLSHIWSTDADAAANSLITLLDIVTQRQNDDNMPAIGALIQFIPDEMMRTVLTMKSADAALSDDMLCMALRSMMEMLTWPWITAVDQWLVFFMRALVSNHRYLAVVKTASDTVEQMFEQLKYLPVRSGFFNVLSYLLLCHQHSPVLFHKIVRMVPVLVETLKQEKASGSNAAQLLNQLAGLLHCLMFQHSGFPDLYGQIVDAIKDLPTPDGGEIRSVLKEYSWVRQPPSDVLKSSAGSWNEADVSKSETGLTGLNNLGNTCYINSVIQVLYMCVSFRRDVLASVPSPNQTLLLRLQKVFAFLSYTQKPAFSPEAFVQDSRPEWFVPGVQQDCSEFLRHLLNVLHEQESAQNHRSSATTAAPTDPDDKTTSGLFSGASGMMLPSEHQQSPASLVERTFGGMVVTTCRCLRCGITSSKHESFMDVALAIPDKPTPTASVSSPQQSTVGSSAGMVGGGQMEPVTAEPSVNATDDNRSVSLVSLLEHFLSTERLEGDNRYHCDSVCRGLEDGERHVEITSAPPFLVLTLLRFAYDARNNRHSKVFADVHYPLTLDVPVHGSRSDPNICQQRFGLIGVIVHSGSSSDGGHYYCYARHGLQKSGAGRISETGDDVDFFHDRWYMFNDSRVSATSFDSFHDLTRKFSRDTPYVLLYRRIDIPAGTGASSGHIPETRTVGEDGFGLDPPLHGYLRQAVDEDNLLYLQERESARRKASLASSRGYLRPMRSNYYDDDDNNGGMPPSSCGGGMNSFHQGPRTIF